MARPWRIQYAGAYYHVLARGNEGRNIFRGDEDRKMFLETPGETCDRFDVEIYAFVLMSNHCHLLLQTRSANLSRTIQWFGVTYKGDTPHREIPQQRGVVGKLGFNLPAGLHSVHTRELDLYKYEVRGQVLRKGHGVRTVCGHAHDNGHSVLFQVGLQDTPKKGGIISDEGADTVHVG